MVPLPQSSYCPISPLLKARSCLYTLSTSLLFPFSLKHIPVRFSPHHSVNTAPVSHQGPPCYETQLGILSLHLPVLSAGSATADHSLFLEILSFGHTVFCLPSLTLYKLPFLECPRLGSFVSFSNSSLFLGDLIQPHDYITSPLGSLIISQTQHIQS